MVGDMGKTARQFNDYYQKYKKRFKKPIMDMMPLFDKNFTDDEFVAKFEELYPHLWDDLCKQYKYWHNKNEYIIRLGKKSRYNFRKPYNFILDCSISVRKKIRNSDNELSKMEKEEIEFNIKKYSNKKLQISQEKVDRKLYLIQEIEPAYAKKYINEYFNTVSLHKKLEIMRELSKYYSDNIVQFFYKVNAKTRNHSLKIEAMKYIQGLGLPFVLRRKKKGKKNFIDNETVKNESSPEVLMKRLYDDELEKHKKYDVFISHNSRDEKEIAKFFKKLNRVNQVAYVDWVNDRFDLKREWCNASTAEVIKRRIEQSKIVAIYYTDNIIKSQWCPWEIGYADALGKKICLYGCDFSDIPQFYLCYPKLVDENGELYIIIQERKIKFVDWIKE